jgi:hypothetical protein
VLHLLGVNVVPLLTVGSASTLILGLASQQLLSNAVTGVSIVSVSLAPASASPARTTSCRGRAVRADGGRCSGIAGSGPLQAASPALQTHGGVEGHPSAALGAHYGSTRLSRTACAARHAARGPCASALTGAHPITRA